LLPELLPKYKPFASVVKVIDIRASANGMVLHTYLNAPLQQAAAIISDPVIDRNENRQTQTPPISAP
jgi:hypothetical protein